MAWWKSLFYSKAKPYISKSALVNALFPTQCPFCGDVLSRHEMACESCLEELPHWLCKGHPAELPPFISGVEAMYYYDTGVREAIMKMKFHSDYDAAKVLGETIGRMVHSRYRSIPIDALIPVPMTRPSRMKRGYNQTEWLAKEVAVQTDLPVWNDVLKKVRNTPNQHMQELEDRQDNLKGAFEVIKMKAVKGKTLLLIDDVYTSGWTASHCAEALLQAGAHAVYVAVAARAASKSEREKENFRENA